MSQTSPFHTVNDDDKSPKHRVYHDNNKCPASHEILPQNWRPGKEAGSRLCKECKRLDQHKH